MLEALALTLVLCGPSLHADEPEDGTPTIAWRQDVRRHRTEEDVQRACGSHRVRACLEFVSERFDCHCERVGQEWQLRAQVHLDILIHFVRPDSISHEILHLFDIRRALPRTLNPYLAMRFAEPAECEAFARVISHSVFATEIMNRLRMETNRKLQ